MDIPSIKTGQQLYIYYLSTLTTTTLYIFILHYGIMQRREHHPGV